MEAFIIKAMRVGNNGQSGSGGTEESNEQIKITEFFKTNGIPIFACLVSNSYYLNGEEYTD